MKHTLNKLSLAVAASIFVAGSALALSADQALTDQRGDRILDNYGDCILTHDGAGSCKSAVVEKQDISFGADAFFAFDKAELRPEAKIKLDELVSKLQQVPEVRSISLAGHTDGVGSDKYNQGLSERRANAVANYLVAKGINPAVLQTAGYGKSNPIATNATAEGRAQNRRVDLQIETVK